MEIELHDGKRPILLRGEAGVFEFCYKVKVKDKTTGKETLEWRPQKWYCSLSTALEKLWRMKVSHSSATTIEELLQNVRSIHKEIMGIGV